MIEHERERKQLLTEKEYAEALELLQQHYSERVIQLNYYYDTDSFQLRNKKETLRIRQTGERLQLQWKHDKSYSDGVHSCKEYVAAVETVPKAISHPGDSFICFQKGCLVTERSNYHLEGAVLSLDKNYYLGKVDYEMEIEYLATNEIPLPPFLPDFGTKSRTSGKYSRFVSRLTEQEQG